MNELHVRLRQTVLVACCWMLGLSGCVDPIHDSVLPPSTAAVVLTSKSDTSRYDWPLTRDGYVVAKPPQMAYVTSFGKRLGRPDPVTAKVVPWSEEGLDKRALRFLRHAYGPVSDRPNVVLRLTKEQFVGPQAFDVSVDGSRLIVIDDQGLALYKTTDGTLVGHLKLPAEVAAANPPVDAVRFCGKSNDFLVASPQQIFRISSKDKSVTRTKGCGESVAQWIVNDDDKSMIIRTESGKLFGGDPTLNFFSAYSLGKDLTFDAVSLSPDGKRIGVCLDGIARTYVQDNFQVIDQVDYRQAKLDPNVSIASGVYTEAWADGDGIFYTYTGEDGNRHGGVYHMLWKPLQISMCAEEVNSNYYLILGQRFFNGTEQLVLFDYGVVARNNSLPTVIDEMPTRIAHGRNGAQVALLDSGGLSLIERDHWRTSAPVFPEEWVYRWIDEDKMSVVEKLLEIVESQDRYAFGISSEELRSRMINAIAKRWRYLDQNEPNGEMLARLEDWRLDGSQLALTASGLRHYHRAWNERGSGTSDTVSRQGWQGYQDRSKLAKEDLDRAIALGDPPLVAIEYRIDVGLEGDEGLKEVDPLCRQASELYPGELEPHASIAYKLLPRWMGETGDSVSFALSAAKAFEGGDGDVLYSRIIGRLAYSIHWGDTLAWKSYDSQRMQRGLEESMRRGLHDGVNPFLNWLQLRNRARNQSMSDQLLEHLLGHRAGYPYILTDGHYEAEQAMIHHDASRIRGGKSYK